MKLCWVILISAVFSQAFHANGFSRVGLDGHIQSFSNRRPPVGRLFGVIKGEAVDSIPLDENLGGVGLAKRSAIKISGVVNKGKACEVDVIEDLIRYEKMEELDMVEAASILDRSGCKIVSNGMGKELYYFPDSSTNVEDKIIQLCPIEAVKKALLAISEDYISNANTLVFNFLGGDDLIFGEVKEAVDLLVRDLAFSEKARVKFNSVSFTEFEEGTCAVTIISSGGKVEGLKGFEKSLACGELYIYNEKWYTVTEEDITTAVE